MRTLLFICLVTLFGAHLQAKEPTGQKPNVLFLAIDDLNDWIAPFDGYPGLKLPNFARLAKRGVTFSRCYCSAPACNPSRASLMCGIRPSTSGVYHNNQPWRPALPKAVTLAQHFMAHGYKVEGGGKIFHGGFNDAKSWHKYFKRPGDPKPKTTPVNGIKNTAHFDWGPVQVDDHAMSDQKVTDWAVNFLKQKQDKPFFLAVGLFRPHLPWYVPKKYFDQYPLSKIKRPEVPDDDLDDIPKLGKRMARPEGDHRKVTESNNWDKAIQGYLASITFADHCVGQLLDALENSEYGKNTIIVLWGDHGWHLGEKKHWRKFSLWEEATRVPMIISVPGMTKGDSRCQRTTSLLDIYPTLVDLCGLKENTRLEGHSLVPLLRDPKASWEHPAITTHGRNNHAVRSEQWRYIRYRDGTEELYNHEQDPMEWKNLAQDEKVASIKSSLAKHLPTKNVEDAKAKPKQKKKKARKKP